MKTIVLIISTILAFTTIAQDSTIVVDPKRVPVIAVPPPSGSRAELIDPENDIVAFPDVEAEMYGGMPALKQFIIDNIQYPEEAIKNKIVGKVYLRFVVRKDGSVTDISIEQGTHELLDKEAKRLLSIMPKWKPGELKGKPVSTIMRLPMNFTLWN
jgi:protein TonB